VFRYKIGVTAVTMALDILFWLGAALCLFTLGLGPGEGELRLFMLISAVVGGALYFLGPSKIVLKAFNFILDCALKLLHLALTPFRALYRLTKKILENIKKLFKKILAWVTITIKSIINAAMRKTEPTSNPEVEYDENKAGRYYYENTHSGGGAVRGMEPPVAESEDNRNKSVKRKVRGRDRVPNKGKRGIQIRHRA
jgi:hypothetical protein